MLPRGNQIELLFKDESAYGTLPTGNFTKTYIYSHGLEEKNPLEDDALLGQARNNDRDATAPVEGLPTHGGPMVVPLCLSHFGYWLKHALGAPTTTGAPTDYQHIFTSGAATLPSRSVEIKTPKQGGFLYMQHKGLMLNKLTLEASRAGNFQRVSLDILGQKETKATSTGGGTPAAVLALDRVLARIGVFKVDTVVAELMSVNAAYDNKLKPLEYMGNDYVSGYDSDDNATFTGSLRLRFKTEALYDQAIAKTNFAGELLFQRTSTRLISFATANTRLERAGLPIGGPGGIEQTFNFRAEQSAIAPMLTVTLKNGVASY
jgi:hypothetical protein